ncbi:MAG: D-alanyl-D-alanine carboxypeptidase family protein [Christensenellales bacterium]|jgi:D-alanyl-D-alanine carboxypeptidase (penicillin-binding protein 5/6)
MRKKLALSLAFLLILIYTGGVQAAPTQASAPMCAAVGGGLLSALAGAPAVGAQGAAVADAQTGRILISHNGRTQLPMASTTKVMTALVALERCDLADEVAIPDACVGVEGSSIYLQKGDTYRLETLLYGLMLRSGNDAAESIACHVGGSVEGFVALMNAKAQELGCMDTHFANPHGLPAEGHYTTAEDLAVIAAAAMRNETFRKIVSTKSITLEGRAFVNKNKLLYDMEDCNGVKTGFTKQAGRCLVSGASRDGVQVVAVVLNSPDMYNTSRSLLEQGLGEVTNTEVVKTGQPYGIARVENGNPGAVAAVAADDLSLPLREGEWERLELEALIPPSQAPLTRGQSVGQLIVRLDGVELGQVRLISDRDAPVEENSGFWGWLRGLLGQAG